VAVSKTPARSLATAGGAIPVDITKLQLPRLLGFASVARFVHPWLQVGILGLFLDAFIFIVSNA